MFALQFLGMLKAPDTPADSPAPRRTALKYPMMFGLAEHHRVAQDHERGVVQQIHLWWSVHAFEREASKLADVRL